MHQKSVALPREIPIIFFYIQDFVGSDFLKCSYCKKCTSYKRDTFAAIFTFMDSDHTHHCLNVILWFYCVYEHFDFVLWWDGNYWFEKQTNRLNRKGKLVIEKDKGTEKYKILWQ